MRLPDELLTLLRAASPCFISTVMSDGSPQLTEVWVDTDGERIVVNIVDGMLKARNLRRDPRVAVLVTDPEDVRRYFSVRGRVVEITTEGAADHIEVLSQRYLGTAYPWFGGRDQVRLKVTIKADRVHGVG